MAAPLGDFQFKSPSFNGIGYSSHVLTIENQEATRQKARDDKIQSALANNSCTVTASSTCTGSINFQGSTIAWSRVSDVINCTGSANATCILLAVTDTTGTTTSIYVPLESFNMPGN